MTDEVNYLFGQQIMDANEKAYRIISRMEDPANTLLVSSVGGNGGALQFCITHSIAYSIHDTCSSCRTQVLEQGLGTGVTSCDTP